MSVYLVRHAKAGQRSRWDGDDRLRPLSKAGWVQSHSLAERLAAFDVPVLVSSPYVRCVQTLEPLGERLGLDVAVDERLQEGAPFEASLALLAEVPDGAVLCSHGDVIPDSIDALVRRGLRVRTEPDWRKATVWVLDRDHTGGFVEASCWPPPQAQGD
jgi:8-oxo-dGTP diphosphatase